MCSRRLILFMRLFAHNRLAGALARPRELRFMAIVLLAATLLSPQTAWAQDPQIQEFSGTDIPSEVAQIIQECNGFIDSELPQLIDKKKDCYVIVLDLTHQAMNNALVTNVGKGTLKSALEGLKALYDAVAEPEEGLEKLTEAALDAAVNKAKEELKKKLKGYFLGNPDVIVKYTASGKVSSCTYDLTITWDVKQSTFLVRTTGDCSCAEVTARVAGKDFTHKLGKWQSNISGTASLSVKADADRLVRVLNVGNFHYSGAGDCACNDQTGNTASPPPAPSSPPKPPPPTPSTTTKPSDSR